MLKLGCARGSSDEQESPKRDALAALGVAPERIYVAHGVTGTNQHRPGNSAVVAQMVPAIRRPARPNARARSPTKDQPGCPQEPSSASAARPESAFGIRSSAMQTKTTSSRVVTDLLFGIQRREGAGDRTPRSDVR